MKTSFISLLLLASIITFGQATNLDSIQPNEGYDNIHVKKLSSNIASTSFVIWVKREVKAHKHQKHNESLYVLEGTAQMTLDKDVYSIKKGDYIDIPKNTVHSVIVKSSTPLKVLSVQAPEFLGKDRIFVD